MNETLLTGFEDDIPTVVLETDKAAPCYLCGSGEAMPGALICALCMRVHFTEGES